ncbi:4265_t:CDS:2 [Acaulospora morrowiae]|uniref:4265_t:CDS:1 n=1 Tax=Acaulospora morrowiae TaxID=94023 RepID=A0A9N9NS27_9GLOM|nr:4265_t:CDS:2 [Acaulospora morrowiae]
MDSRKASISHVMNDNPIVPPSPDRRHNHPHQQQQSSNSGAGGFSLRKILVDDGAAAHSHPHQHASPPQHSQPYHHGSANAGGDGSVYGGDYSAGTRGQSELDDVGHQSAL